ncbi:F-box/LRR-repeat protein [Striga hermonthica]|uniref:F-box/LRR-repeat protein n=1 Tax=Striga hermonthica TaxID=68872 RepID=A0A9N7RKB2_STRHE|nr:F-box/LRR-repeat protein [Striga hermonthica]
MKKQKQAAETEETLSTAMADDRISNLPIHTLHDTENLLQMVNFKVNSVLIGIESGQKEAVRTCLLSKHWRYIGSTRPDLDFYEEPFNDTQEKFVSVVDRTLQGYRDQNLSIHKLHLNLYSRPAVTLLNKWISMIPTLNMKVFKLNFLLYPHDLPSAVFLAESLEDLHLRKCRLSLAESVPFKSLRTLTLEQVQVDGRTLETKMLDCPLLRRLVLDNCWQLRNVRVSEAASPGLKHFVLHDYSNWISGRSIEMDVPNIETVSIRGPWIWSHHQSALLFSRLTNLDLNSVILSSESFDLLSFACPTLESLTVDNCYGFEEFHLASNSVNFLHFRTTEVLLKGVTICAPNIVSFQFTAHISQALATFSFTTTTSKEWSSEVFLSSHKDDPDLDLNSWFLKLRRLLKALSGSWISLLLQMDAGPRDVPCSAVLGGEPPVVLRYLIFGTCKCHRVAWYMGFTNGLFRVCRPSHVYGCRAVSESGGNYRLSEFQLKLLANKKVRTKTCFWGHDLEQVFVESFDGQQWQLMQWRTLGELRKRTQDRNIRLRLKWRC